MTNAGTRVPAVEGVRVAVRTLIQESLPVRILNRIQILIQTNINKKNDRQLLLLKYYAKREHSEG